MRVCIGFVVVVACIACKKADSPSSKGRAGSGSAIAAAAGDAAAVPVADAVTVAVADAGAPLAPFCVDEDDRDASLVVVASDATSVTFCFQREDGFSTVTQAPAPARSKCVVADFTKGTLTAAPPNPAAREEPAPKAYDLSKLKLPKQGFVGALSPDGKLVAATSSEESAKLFIYDAATGKEKKVVTWKEADGGCMEEPRWIGDNIYVQYNVCAGPGATGWIVTPAGKKLGSPQAVNPTNKFYPAGGTRYVFEDFGGGSLELIDAATGKSLKVIEFGCDDCMAFGPQGIRLVPIGGGKLVQFGGTLALVDPAAMKLEKLIKWPACPAPKP